MQVSAERGMGGSDVLASWQRNKRPNTKKELTSFASFHPSLAPSSPQQQFIKADIQNSIAVT